MTIGFDNSPSAELTDPRRNNISPRRRTLFFAVIALVTAMSWVGFGSTLALNSMSLKQFISDVPWYFGIHGDRPHPYFAVVKRWSSDANGARHVRPSDTYDCIEIN